MQRAGTREPSIRPALGIATPMSTAAAAGWQQTSIFEKGRPMKPNSKLTVAIAAVLGSASAGVAHAATAPEAAAISDVI